MSSGLSSGPPKIVVYGIPNCDTMKKARSWLQLNRVPYEFHNYKASGIDLAKLAEWSEKVGWEVLLNRSGSTFRKLDEAAKQDLTEAKALKLMAEQPSMIKRPVVERGKLLLVGFSPEKFALLRAGL